MVMRNVSPGMWACVAAFVTACGSAPDAPKDGPLHPDAPLHDAAPDSPPDAATPDAPLAVDADHDGHPADADCDDNDPHVWQNLAYSFRDADGDGHTVAAAGMICSGASLPPGYSTVAGEPDCDDADPAVFTLVTGFLDTDGDGVGDGMAMAFCTAGGLPAGFVAIGGDCATEDPTRWTNLAYSFRDADGDGAAVPEIGLVCSGATLPPGYLTTAPVGRPLDCDDTNPAVSVALTVFHDADRDGFGAGASQIACTGGAPPSGFSTNGTDCDDTDGTAWASLLYTAVDFDGDGFTTPAMGMRCTAGVLLPPYYAAPVGSDCDDSDATRWALLTYRAIDADGDGFTVPASGQLCTNGALPAPFRASENGNDCNDADPTLTHFAVLYPDQDGDGVGAPPRQVLCLGTTTPAGLVPGGYDEDDTDPAVIETEDFDDLLDLIVLGN
jgi:hypothetical protein